MSIAFGLAGIVVVRYLIPAVEKVHALVLPEVYVFLAIVLAMLFGADCALTEASLSALLNDVNRMHNEFNEIAQDKYEMVTSAPRMLEQKLLEGKEILEERHEQLARAYAEKLSLNQKRILLGIKKFTPRPDLISDHTDRDRIISVLKEKVRELRGTGV